MTSPALLSEEDFRLLNLASLNILDTPAEERFDRLTRLARKLFGVPIAAVSLVDAERAWFKSCAGAEVDEVPRDLAFCTHAVNANEVLLIPDATQDARFAGNPLVVNDPEFRFYVGWPLRIASGAPLGTLCLLDTRPRDFAADDLALLRDLAEMAERELAALSMATTDELTGLSNRRGFFALAQKALRICQRGNLPATLLMFDLDFFKSINDAHGHGEGDHALQRFAMLLTDVFRASDVIARLGGDEFIVMLTNTDATEVQAALRRFGNRLTELNRSQARGYEIRYSVGMAAVDPSREASLENLLAEADRHMYAAKNTRR